MSVLTSFLLFLLFSPIVSSYFPSFFFFNDTATTEIYTLSLHDALPIYIPSGAVGSSSLIVSSSLLSRRTRFGRDRKSTRLNSSHVRISYAVFCLKKKKKKEKFPANTARHGLHVSIPARLTS